MALIDVPLAGQSLGATRDSIRQNFQTINTGFAIDHVEYGSGTQGYHNKLTLPVQASAPAFPGATAGIYSLLYAPTGLNEIFINKSNAGTQIPMTASFANASSGWTWLPSGIKMVWGSNTIVASGTLTVNYSSVTGFPGFGTGATPMLTRFRSVAPPADAFVYIRSYNTTGFVASSSTGLNNVAFTWMAIGL